MGLIELFVADRAQTTVTSGGTDAPVSGTVETWVVASSAMFGVPVANVSQFHVSDPFAPSEIIAVTAVSATTWTVTRGADSTTPIPHAAGFAVCQVATAGYLASLAPLAAAALTLLATTGTSGFALQNATPTILTWTAPSDGAGHRVLLMGEVHVTSPETGGALTLSSTFPDGTANVVTVQAGGLSNGGYAMTLAGRMVKAGSTVTLAQSTALTAGAAVAFAELWGS